MDACPFIYRMAIGFKAARSQGDWMMPLGMASLLWFVMRKLQDELQERGRHCICMFVVLKPGHL